MEKYKVFCMILIPLAIMLGCKREGEKPTEPDTPESIDTTKGCPIFDLTPASPYENPVWHPSGQVIGFNHTTLKEIKYLYGFNCPRQATYVYQQDSVGFWLINVDGTNKRRVLPYKLTNPAWSPDGKWLAFSKDAQIYKMPFDGTNFSPGAMISLTTSGRNFSPSFSPDGTWITYDSNVETTNGMNFIWKMNEDGLAKKRIAYSSDEGEIRMPSWANDFSIVHIRYLTGVPTGAPEVFRMDSTGNQVKRLTDNDQYEYYPKSSPDQSKVAFISVNLSPGDQIQLYSVNNLGGGQQKLTQNGATNFSWGPANKIVYVSFDLSRIARDRGVLFTMDKDGSNKQQLTYNAFKLTR